MLENLFIPLLEGSSLSDLKVIESESTCDVRSFILFLAVFSYLSASSALSSADSALLADNSALRSADSSFCNDS